VARVNGQYFVFVAESPEGKDGKDGKDGSGGKLVAHQRGIKVGSIVGDAYPVLDGLKAGDKVVISGGQKLVDGAPVAPAPDAPAPGAQTPAPSP
jgi:hypothetical protein